MDKDINYDNIYNGKKKLETLSMSNNREMIKYVS